MSFWEIITIFGDIQFWIGVILTSLLFLFTTPKRVRRHIIWFVFQVLPAIIVSYGIVYILKLILKIPRPCLGLSYCPNTYSFPSGHAAVIFTAATILSLHYKNKGFAPLLLIFAGLVAFSRIMLGVHRIEDIIFGSIIGLIVGLIIQRLCKKYYKNVLELFQKFIK